MVQRRLFQWFFSVIIFASGMALSIYTYQGVRKSDEAKMLAELQKETYEQSVRASLLFTRAPQILNSFAALFVVSDFVSQQEFKNFASYLIKNEQEISAVMWTPYVLAEERKKYEMTLMHEMGHDHGFIDIQYPDRHQIASPLRNFYFPIMYVEPREQGANLLGIDLNGRPLNHALRMAAMNSGLVFTTPVFSELTDPHGAAMIAIYHPVHIPHPKSSKKPGKFLGFLLMLMTPEVRVRSRMFYERKQFIEHSVIGGNLNILRRLFPSTWVRNEELVK